MKETMTKLAVNFGLGEAFDVFVKREQLGQAIVVLAGRGAEVLVDPLPLPAGLDRRIKEFHERHEAFKRAKDELGADAKRPMNELELTALREKVCAEARDGLKARIDAKLGESRPGRRYRLSGDGWVVTFTHFNLVEVNGKLNDDQLSDGVRNLAGKNGGAAAVRECIRIALHFLKSRFVMMPLNNVSTGRPISCGGVFVFPDKVQCWNEDVDARIEAFANELNEFDLQATLFHLVKICGQERDKSVTGTAVEAPPAIVDGIDTSQGVAIKPAPRKAQEELARWVIDTREDAIRESLIKLGWKPPGYKPMITVGWPTIAILSHGKEVHLQDAILIPDSELHNTANRIAKGELGGQPKLS